MLGHLVAFALIVAPADFFVPQSQWVKKKQSTRIAAAPKEKKPSLVQNLNNGSYLRFSDGSMWNVRPQDTAISQGWISEVTITMSPSGDTQYPTKLTNDVSLSSVLAKRVQSVPATAPPPQQPPAPTGAPPSNTPTNPPNAPMNPPKK